MEPPFCNASQKNNYNLRKFQKGYCENSKLCGLGSSAGGLTIAAAINLFPNLFSSVILKVIETEPGLKGNTATNATKPAIVETGARINVPLFINEGDNIKIETQKGTYLERVK